jgi:hypothetical protein
MSGIGHDPEKIAVYLIRNPILTQSERYHRHHHKHSAYTAIG